MLSAIAASGCAEGDSAATSLALSGSIGHVQPFTGIALWSDNPAAAGAYKGAIQLEFSYIRFDSVSTAKGVWDWAPVDALLADIASRGHQAIIRFRYEYPGEAFGLPAWIKAEPGYTRRSATVTDGGTTTSVELPDWSCPALMSFNTEFFRRFAERYDGDARLAYVQAGFGFWSEYHLNIDQDRSQLGVNFPSIDYQAGFLAALSGFFKATPLCISIDSAQPWGPFSAHPELLALGFGSFDDSFLCEEHETVNKAATEALGGERWKVAPRGGEFSYYTDTDQRLALAPSGPHGTSWESAAAAYHMSYVIGNDQPGYQTADRVAAAGMAAGYRFAVTSATANAGATTVVLRNDGVAPLYFDAWPALGGIRSATSLKGLLPGESRTFVIQASPPAGQRDITGLFAIACDRLVAGQGMQFSAALPSSRSGLEP
jgi:hypothetical protein